MARKKRSTATAQDVRIAQLEETLRAITEVKMPALKEKTVTELAEAYCRQLCQVQIMAHQGLDGGR